MYSRCHQESFILYFLRNWRFSEVRVRVRVRVRVSTEQSAAERNGIGCRTMYYLRGRRWKSMEARGSLTYELPWKHIFIYFHGSLWNLGRHFHESKKKCQKVWHDFFLWKLAEVRGSS